ncbi:MAG: 1-deoxy-D-xylulose-5-phosphate synthase [Clostridia bacterium]|nr:1-deoxy-D-xylulose-5-phosphate synthase [Clostridia bacterium]
MMYKYLDKVNSPEDLRKISDKDIPILAHEMRAFITDAVEKHGGHLASNLGAVELTLAIHKVFNSPYDRIIFDVGHQAYIHKIITGRKESFDTLRIPGGLSGFTSRRESPHDPFGAGHSTTSLSAALGFAEADKIKGDDRYTVCVIGDGACTGGMMHEALNNCKPELPLVIVLNENGMSISKNNGAFASYISKVRASGKYLKLKQGTNTFLSKIPLVGKWLHKAISAVKNCVKRIIYKSNYFEELGLYYMGPIDGNDYEKTLSALRLAREMKRTVILHLKTVKGKGHPGAESSPEGYHSISSVSGESYHSVFADELISLAEENKNIVAVTAAMGIGTGLDRFGERYSKRYFDVGIAEPHALTFSAALAADGLVPFVALYSTFMQRGYDNILHDIALQSLPVKIMIDRAGLALGDGATHHGIFDVSILSSIPGIDIFAPVTYSSLRAAMSEALKSDAPVAIRYPNSSEHTEIMSRFKRSYGLLSPLVDFDLSNPPEYVFITYGALASQVALAAQILEKQGIYAGIIIAERIKPLCDLLRLVKELNGRARRIVFAEEGIKRGGMAEGLLSSLMDAGFDFSKTEYLISAIDESFASPDRVCDLYDYVGLSPEKLAKRMKKE